MNRNEESRDFNDKPKHKKLKSVYRKEKNSEKNRSKQQLRNYEIGFEDDDFEDNFRR